MLLIRKHAHDIIRTKSNLDEDVPVPFISLFEYLISINLLLHGVNCPLFFK